MLQRRARTTSFHDRYEAGALLATRLGRYRNDPNVVVLGLARGGIPVAYEIARVLRAPLDSFEVRKLGTPGYEELAMGAIGSGGAYYLNPEVIAALHISCEQIVGVVTRERNELERREQLYCDGCHRPELGGKTIILVDHGVATGASTRAALASLRLHEPARIVLAIPVAPRKTIDELRAEVDEIVCWTMLEPFFAVGGAYDDFDQVSDSEVHALLDRALIERAT